MKICALCLAILLYACPAFCCINIMGTKFNGEGATMSLSGERRLRIALKAATHTEGVKMEAALRGSTNFNDRSDYSAALMYLGRYQEAVTLLTQLEKENPGQYFIAGNLGTAYELCQSNEAALYWIKEEITRNPQAHNGTEWLHAQILESKIAAGKDPAYFTKHSVLNLQPDEINNSKTVIVNGEELPSEAVAQAITDQLEERLKFVKPPDAPVASLLFDYAAIEAGTKTLESAEGILRMAVEYGYPSSQVKPLIKRYNQVITWRKRKQDAFYAMIGITFLALLFWLYKKGIFVLWR